MIKTPTHQYQCGGVLFYYIIMFQLILSSVQLLSILSAYCFARSGAPLPGQTYLFAIIVLFGKQICHTRKKDQGCD